MRTLLIMIGEIGWHVRFFNRRRLLVLGLAAVMFTCMVSFKNPVSDLSSLENKFDENSRLVSQMLDEAIKEVDMIQKNAKDHPSKLVYKDVYKKTDMLFGKVKQLKGDLQIAEAASTADCQGACYLQPIEKLVTIAINIIEATSIVLQRLPVVLQAIQDTYPTITVLVAAPNHFYIDATLKGIKLKIHWMRQESALASDVWNRLVEAVKTPYVLVAKHFLHFDNNAFLEKQVKFLKLTGAIAVGGASRDLTGYWKAGCYQIKIGVFTLKLEEGYRRSLDECMKCDYIDGPLMVKTKDFKLERSRHQTEAMLEWFLKSYLKNSLVLSCPEIMFYQNHINLSTLEETSIQNLAQSWKFDTFVFPEKTLEVSCSQLEFRCHLGDTFMGKSLPRCCIRDHVEGLAKILDKLKNNNVSYYLEGGTLLTATKIGNIVTWDIDSDTMMEEKGYDLVNPNSKWITDNNYVMWEYSRSRNPQGIAKFLYRNNRIELFVSKKDKVESKIANLPKDLKRNLTLVNIGKHWFVSPSNPIKELLQEYGKDFLKHKHKHDEILMNGKYSFYDFRDCRESLLHTCINQYPVDGNLDLFP